jgi:hypothetical protein
MSHVTDAGVEGAESARLSEISRRLEEAAARLGEDGLDRDQAAQLATECAELASEAAVELERQARGGPLDQVPGQEELL